MHRRLAVPVVGARTRAGCGRRLRRRLGRPCSPRPSVAGTSSLVRQGHPGPGSRRTARSSPSPGAASAKSSGGSAPDLVRHRVHRRRPRAGRTLHRHPALRHHRRPGHQGHARRVPSRPSYRVRRRASSATATAARPATRPASSGSGPPRGWARSCKHHFQDAPPTPDATTTTTRPARPRTTRHSRARLRRRAATPGGCTR